MSSRSRFQIEDKISDQDMDMSCEGIVDVPVKEIGQYPRAINIDLSNNHIRVLTVDFASSLRHIVQLDLSKNLLQKLPENFGLLVNLRHLDLYSNQIERLPLSMSKLRKLRWLDLKDNPLVPSLKKIVGECWNAEQCHACSKNVVAFMTEIEQQVSAGEQLENSKEVIWGSQQCGPTSKQRTSNGLSNRNAKPLQTAKQPQEFSSNEEVDEDSVIRDNDSVSLKKKKKRNPNKRMTTPVLPAESPQFPSSNESKQSIASTMIWLGRSVIWLSLFCLLFMLLCGLCLSAHAFKSIVATFPCAEVLNTCLINIHKWIQTELLNPERYAIVRDFAKEKFALSSNYFYTLVESVANSIGALTGASVAK